MKCEASRILRMCVLSSTPLRCSAIILPTSVLSHSDLEMTRQMGAWLNSIGQVLSKDKSAREPRVLRGGSDIYRLTLRVETRSGKLGGR